jgi:nucleoside-diphosphate-sugar epimerase
MFNLAGTLSHIDSITDPHTDLEVNCVSQLSILEACRLNNKDIRIIFAGTRGQYGKIRYTPVDENHPLIPTDVNGINKNAGEQYHLLYHEIHDMKCCSLRLTNTYGPRHQMRHHKQGIINWFIRLAIDGSAITLFDNGGIKRDLTYVDDVVNAFLRAGQSDTVWGNVYNIGGSSHTLKHIDRQL